MMLDEVGVKADLLGKLLAGVEEGQGMVVGFGEELDGAGIGQGMKSAHDLRGVSFELLDEHSGAGIGELETSGVFVDELENELIGGQIALLGHLVDNLLIVIFVEIIGVGIKNGVSSKAIGLVDLKIKTYRGHGRPVNLQ